MSLVHTLEVREEVEIKPKKIVARAKKGENEDSLISERDFSSGDEEKDHVEALSQQTFQSIKKLNLTSGRSASSRNQVIREIKTLPTMRNSKEDPKF